MTRGSPRLYFETARRLHAEQVGHQLRLRLRRLVPAPRPGPPPSSLPLRSGWGPRVGRCRVAPAGDVVAGRFRFWNVERQLDLDRPWVAPDLGRSWNYLVHYFEALPTLVEAAADDPARARALAAFVERWIRVHPVGSLPAWEPYPTALRLVSWIDALHSLQGVTDPRWQALVLASIHVQADWLHRRLERHLLGTHLLKDVKALLVAASIFDTDSARRWRRTAMPLLQRELHAHVGEDGAHVEPSLMYHCTALEDVLDLLNFAGVLEAAAADEATQVAVRMLDVAVATATPTGETPLLGDAWSGGAPSPDALRDYAARLGVVRPAAKASGARLLPTAGIFCWRDETLYLLADVGGIGPPHLSGHGHCDSLSFELWSDGVPFIVDSGTFSYEAGDDRQACRATRAHNTLEIDGREQHEIWAVFRVARRSTVRAAATDTGVDATLVPWFDKRLRVQRRFECATRELRITDRVDGPGAHRVASRLHLHPDCRIESAAAGWILQHGRARVSLSWQAGPVDASTGERARVIPADASGSHFAAAAGELRPNAVLQLQQAGLPFTSLLVIRRLDPQ